MRTMAAVGRKYLERKRRKGKKRSPYSSLMYEEGQADMQRKVCEYFKN